MVTLATPFVCGHCFRDVAALPTAKYPSGSKPTNVTQVEWNDKPRSECLLCPACERMTVVVEGAQSPSPPAGNNVDHLPSDVDKSWREARRSYTATAYTASVLMCRKLLMHMACDKAGTKEGANFTTCIDELISSNELPKSHEPLLQAIRKSGNGGTHKLESIDEKEAKTTIVVTEQCLRNLYELPNQIAGV